MSKRLGEIIGCKDETSSCMAFNRIPDGSNIGSTASCRGEIHRDTTDFCTLTLIAMQGQQAKQRQNTR